ncbi:MAG: hypothetical protein H0W89_07000, partial [Candidatus Levybacteria bacterium]|nr:hypothetical protein [Candidatus Levybacteria bacterium]
HQIQEHRVSLLPKNHLPLNDLLNPRSLCLIQLLILNLPKEIEGNQKLTSVATNIDHDRPHSRHSPPHHHHHHLYRSMPIIINPMKALPTNPPPLMTTMS